MYVQAKTTFFFFQFLSPIIISSVPCLLSLLVGRSDGSGVLPLCSRFLARWVNQFSVLSVVATSASGSCLPNAVSSELCCLAPEQAKSKHSTLWLKGHLSRGGNPASTPKSINRGSLLSHGAAHCHGNAPSEWAEALIPHPPIFAAAFQGSLAPSAYLLSVCSAKIRGSYPSGCLHTWTIFLFLPKKDVSKFKILCYMSDI